MLLILLRHGTAEDGIPDDSRELTKEGRDEIKTVARAMDRFGIKPRIVLSSKRARAVQSAEIAIDEMELKVKLEKTNALDYDRSWDEFSDFLQERLKKEKNNLVILCAGHQPHFGRSVKAAIEGREEEFDLKKGSAIGIRFKNVIEAGEGKLEFYLTPKFAAEMKK